MDLKKELENLQSERAPIERNLRDHAETIRHWKELGVSEQEIAPLLDIAKRITDDFTKLTREIGKLSERITASEIYGK